MKKTTNTLSLVILLAFLSVTIISCNNSKTEKAPKSVLASNLTSEATAVQAYYFHATRRCATCEAVESVTQEALTEYYGTAVSFQSINREENKENPLLEQYKVSGQTLLIVKGDTAVNLTTDAFMDARGNPDKFKAKLKATVDSML